MNRSEFDARIDSVLLSAEKLIPQEDLPNLPYMKLAPNVHDWYDFEHKLWELGEDIRRLILSERKELNTSQIERVCKICSDSKAKRGRQSFVMLFGKKRFFPYAERIAGLLPDEDIDGHIISILYKMGAFQYTELIKPYIDHRTTWIRNEAKRYMQKYGS